MKPYGKSFSRDGCTCSLCRSRGYRKGNGYDSEMRANKKAERQKAKRLVIADLESYGWRQGTLSMLQSIIQSEHAESVARDLLAQYRLQHPGVMTVHDEIVIDADFTGIETRALDIMKADPYWWKGDGK